MSKFWFGKQVLVTGHTGFKGSWLSLWLKSLGANVVGVALPAATTPNLFSAAQVARAVQSEVCDIRNASALATLVKKYQPEIVFHLAAQPLVRASYADPLTTYTTNVMGTVHLLEALRVISGLKVAIMVTTDKVYRNLEHAFPYREQDALGGYDPYSASKAACELVIDSYRDAFLGQQGVALASARAGNVIGGGDWAQDRLIPDAVRAWQSGQMLTIRSPNAIRPWQHVLDPLNAYLVLAEKLWDHPELAGAYNFGPNTHEAASVQEVIDLARTAYGQGEVRYTSANKDTLHEAGWLALEIAKARNLLGIYPKWPLHEAVTRTMRWYQAFDQGEAACALCLAEIKAYTLNT